MLCYGLIGGIGPQFMLCSGYIRSPSNRKIGSKGSGTVDFSSGFIIIFKSINLRPQGLLKVRIPMQNQRFPNFSNHFFSSKGCGYTPLPFMLVCICFLFLVLNSLLNLAFFCFVYSRKRELV
jgi:hypothetical protein